MRIVIGEVVLALVLVFAGKPMIIILVLANVVDYLRFVYQRSKPKPKKPGPKGWLGKRSNFLGRGSSVSWIVSPSNFGINEVILKPFDINSLNEEVAIVSNALDGEWKEMLDQFLKEWEAELKQILEENKIKKNKGRRENS